MNFRKARLADIAAFVARRPPDEPPRVTARAYRDWLLFHAALAGKKIPSRLNATTREIERLRRRERAR